MNSIGRALKGRPCANIIDPFRRNFVVISTTANEHVQP